MSYVTRIAPSPTGMFHLGTARTAYFNWLAARASGGRALLRIDDTDASRNDDAYVDVIMDAMSWLGLDFDAVHRQSDRRVLYRDMAEILLQNDLAYFGDDFVDGRAPMRLHVPADLPAVWNDTIAGTVSISDVHRKQIDGLVLLRSDGSPTYHFASIVDDITMGVNYVIRGTDHLNNTPKQIAILVALKAAGVFQGDIDIPAFAHVGLIDHIVDGKRKKLSKRDDAASLLAYRDRGYDPAAILNFILRLGWSPSDANFDKKVKMLDRDMAVRMFLRDGRMRNSPVLLDPAMLDSLDQRYKRAAKAKES